MKKLTSILALLAAALLVSAAPAPAPAPAAVPEPVAATNEYEFIMLTIWENSPEYQMKTETYGVKVGIFGSFGAPVYGVETSVLASCSPQVKGLKCGLGYTCGREATGVLLAPVNLVDNFKGVAFGVVNVAKKGGIQFGIVNVMENGFLPFFPVFNFAL